MIEIKRNVADDIHEVAHQMVKDSWEIGKQADALREDAILLDLAADAQHRYQVMVDNGINESLAIALAVHLTKR